MALLGIGGIFSLLSYGFQFANAMMKLWGEYQKRQEFIQMHAGLTAEARAKALEECRAFEYRLRELRDPEAFFAARKAEMDAITSRVLSATPGTVIEDGFGTGGTVTGGKP